jgi:hypothetical protein
MGDLRDRYPAFFHVHHRTYSTSGELQLRVIVSKHVVDHEIIDTGRCNYSPIGIEEY